MSAKTLFQFSSNYLLKIRIKYDLMFSFIFIKNLIFLFLHVLFIYQPQNYFPIIKYILHLIFS